jgi:phenylpropionate dioxygenase-like ring-hydroxylating dioxygenase large terminal subunit
MLVEDVAAFRRYWYPVAHGSDVGAAPRTARVLGDDLVVWRHEGRLAAMPRHCPHRGADLGRGWVDRGRLVCPYHGWAFGPDGRCVEIPSAGDAPVPRRADTTAVGVTERYGLVWVNLAVAGREPMPVLPEAEDPGFTVAHEVLELWDAAAPQVMENGLDVSHVAFVHRNSVGTSAAPRLGEHVVERRGPHITFTIEHTARATTQLSEGADATTETVRRVTSGELVQPFVFRGVLHYPSTGLQHVLFKTATPVDNHSTLFCQFIARNDRPDATHLAAVIDLDRRVQAEDKVILEGLASDYPLDVAAQVHTKADRVTLEYRRVLAEVAADTRGGRER